MYNPNSDNINLLFAGDFVPPDDEEIFISDDLRAVLKDKDFSMVNLETPLTLSKNKIEKTGNNFKRHPSVIKHLKDFLFDAVTLSNNHIRDYGDQGVTDTIETCKHNNILTVGAGRNVEEAATPLRLNLKGKKISVLNYSEQEYNIATEKKAGANLFDLIDVVYQIKTEKQLNDFVIVIYHGGLEFHHVPLPGLKKSLEFLIDNGADAVICHHTHVAGVHEVYKEKPICFGLGNFIFDYKVLTALKLHQGYIVRLLLIGNNIKSYFIPIFYNKNKRNLELMDYDMEQDFQKEISKQNVILSDEKIYNNYWNSNSNSLLTKYYSSILHGYSFLGKIRKRLQIQFYNRKRLMIIRNYLQCDSHREVFINSLNNYLKD